MPLVPGTRIGPYEVVAQIGVGGMGEVYQATDTNLKRQVAIKVLPTSVAGDAERRSDESDRRAPCPTGDTAGSAITRGLRTN